MSGGSSLVCQDHVAENQKTAAQLQGLVDPLLDLVPFAAGAESHVDFIVKPNGQLYLSIKVSKV